jgi:hypothetical protein
MEGAAEMVWNMQKTEREKKFRTSSSHGGLITYVFNRNTKSWQKASTEKSKSVCQNDRRNDSGPQSNNRGD